MGALSFVFSKIGAIPFVHVCRVDSAIFATFFDLICAPESHSSTGKENWKGVLRVVGIQRDVSIGNRSFALILATCGAGRVGAWISVTRAIRS